MSVQEVLEEIRKLPVLEQKELLDKLSHNLERQTQPQTPINEEEFLQLLYAEGVIGNVPDLSRYTDQDDDFKPLEISGKPTSEIIIEERQ